jgi:hypothetical protein
MKTIFACSSVVFFAIIVHATPCESALVADRASLQASLSNGTRYDDNFDLDTTSNYLVDDQSLDILDNATLVPGFGTGIVSDGVSLSSPLADRNLVLLRQTGIGVSSGAVYHKASFTSSQSTLRIRFLIPVTHAGFDYFEFASANGRGATIDVWRNGASSADSFYVVPEVGTANQQFFGYADIGGIDFIDITSDAYALTNSSPIIDNLTFGNAVAIPEPSPFLFVSVGGMVVLLVKRNRRQNRNADCEIEPTDR